MKCTVCKKSASIKIPRHNAAFCETHYHEHILRQVSRTIRRYWMFGPDKRLMLGVSGGKDSMGAWKILAELGYAVEAVHINNGFGEYSAESEEKVRRFAEQHGLPLHVYTFRELMGSDFDAACQVSRKPPCSLCGTIKRYFLNQLTLRNGCDVLVTGHNLDDESGVLFGNVMNWYTDYMSRQAPVLAGEEGMAARVKPLVMITDREMKLFVDMHGISVVQGSCPHSKGATSLVYKDLLNTLEETSPGVKAQFYFGFLRKLKDRLPPPEQAAADAVVVQRCPVCGYKTTNPDQCFVCSLKEKLAVEEG